MVVSKLAYTILHTATKLMVYVCMYVCMYASVFVISCMISMTIVDDDICSMPSGEGSPALQRVGPHERGSAR